MNHSVKTAEDKHIISFDGDVDLEHSPVARKILLDVVEKAQGIFVDLAAVNYMDSSGIASLVEAYQQAKKKGVSFVLVSVSPAVLRVLHMARLDKVFTIHENVESARHAGV